MNMAWVTYLNTSFVGSDDFQNWFGGGTMTICGLCVDYEQNVEQISPSFGGKLKSGKLSAVSIPRP